MGDDQAKDSVVQLAEKQDAWGILVRRWIGAWIDFITVAILFAALAGLSTFLVTGWKSNPPAELVDRAVWLFFAWVPVSVLGYYVGAEVLWGRTLGKLVTGLIVVGPTGDKPNLTQAFIRTLSRLVEVNPLFLGGIPAGIAVLCSKRRQRIGDMLATTYVVPNTAFDKFKPIDDTVFS